VFRNHGIGRQGQAVKESLGERLFPDMRGDSPVNYRLSIKVAAALIGLLMLLGACGPVESTSLIVTADTNLHNAMTADAEKKSPYEYYSAEQYLHKAREKWGTSDFEYSIDYATEARDMAKAARERSMKNETD
jgi:uncharacterized protein DUF4398